MAKDLFGNLLGWATGGWSPFINEGDIQNRRLKEDENSRQNQELELRKRNQKLLEDENARRGHIETFNNLLKVAGGTAPDTPEHDAVVDALMKHPMMPDDYKATMMQVRDSRRKAIGNEIANNTGLKSPFFVPTTQFDMNSQSGSVTPDYFSQIQKNPNYTPPASLWGNTMNFGDNRSDAYAALAELRRQKKEESEAKIKELEALTQPKANELNSRAGYNNSRSIFTDARTNQTNLRTPVEIEEIQSKIQRNNIQKDAYGNPITIDQQTGTATPIQGIQQKTEKTQKAQTENKDVEAVLKDVMKDMSLWGASFDESGNEIKIPTLAEVDGVRARLNRIGYDLVGENGTQFVDNWGPINTPAKKPTYRIIKLDEQGMPTKEALQSSGENGSGNIINSFNNRELLRDPYASELEYFKKNPSVAGMATEDDRVILNPYSGPGINKDAVIKNESVRIFMKKNKIVPDFSLTTQQLNKFKGTEYEKNELELKRSIVARILSGDPSAGDVTQEQRKYADYVKHLIGSAQDPNNAVESVAKKWGF